MSCQEEIECKLATTSENNYLQNIWEYVWIDRNVETYFVKGEYKLSRILSTTYLVDNNRTYTWEMISRHGLISWKYVCLIIKKLSNVLQQTLSRDLQGVRVFNVRLTLPITAFRQYLIVKLLILNCYFVSV